MSKIDKRVKDILAKYHDKPEDAVWFHKQSGQWIAKHKDLEIVAAKAGIVFEAPVVAQMDLVNKVCALIVTGKLKDRVEWSVGEATSYNSQNQYYGSMAEKRGKDRVILKLIGLHGYVYSDEEIEVKGSPEVEPEESDVEKAITQFKDQYKTKVRECQTEDELNEYISSPEIEKYMKRLKKKYPNECEELQEVYANRFSTLTAPPPSYSYNK